MRVNLHEWESKCQRYFMKVANVDENKANSVVGAAITADSRGVSSHGVIRLPAYAERIKKGLIDKYSEPFIEMEKDSLLKINANNGLGQYTTQWTSQLMIQKTKEHGICTSLISNSNHIGILSYYALMAAQNGLIAYIMCNTSPLVVPYGGAKAAIGTNPLCWAIPGKDFPIVLDMAISPAKGKVRNMLSMNQPVPEGWALDKHGNPTTDAKEAMEGAMLPIAGPKGYGLGIIVECMAAILSGANYGLDVTQPFDDMEHSPDLGVFMMFLDVDQILPFDHFVGRIERYKTMVRSVERQKNIEEIFLPGEIEHRKAVEANLNGIEVDSELYNLISKSIA